LGIRGTFDFVVSDSLKRADGTGRIEEKEETEDDLKEIVGDWLDSGIGLKEDKTDVISSMNPETGDSSSIGEEQGKRATDEAVFMSSYIPRNLGEVYDPERDIDKIAAGKGDELIYASLTGVNGAGQNREEEAGRTKSALKGEKSGGEAEQRRGVKWEDELEEDEEESEDDDDYDEDGKEKKSRGFRHEDKDAKKVSSRR
jgi:RIO kinase 1